MKPLKFILILLLSALTAYAQEDSVSQKIFDDFFGKDNAEQADFNARLYPVRPTADTVDCTLSVFLPDKDSPFPVKITLECNQLPDKVPPTMIADRQVLEKLSESSSLQIKDGVKTYEYRYQYKFFPTYSGYFTCHVDGLAFGGTPYTNALVFRADAGKGNPDGHTDAAGKRSITKGGVILTLIGSFVLSYILFWLHFRKESEVGFAAFVLRHRRIPLDTDWAITHYGLSQMTFSIATACLILYIWEYISGKNNEILPNITLVALAIGVVSWFFQRRKLYFKEIRTTLSKEDIFDAIGTVGERNRWSLDHAGEDCIVAHTNPGMWAPTWGEQIFVVFDEGRIWVNSVNDLNKRTSIVSFGYTKRNIRRVEEAIKHKENSL